MSVFLVLLLQTLLLIPLFYAYNVKVIIETAADEGNEDTDVYLTLLGQNYQTVSQKKRLGKFADGEIREFLFYTDNSDMECLEFTLKGTDGWRMERSTVVLENGVTYTFENPRRAKLDNTFWWQESSLKFCSRNTVYFELVDKAGRNVTEQREGLLLYNGGTVCDDKFSDNSAKAICRAMGRPHENVTWTSYPGDSLKYGSVQSGKSIQLDKVKCATSEWYQCSFLTTHQCKHEEDVFLTCGDDSVTKGLSRAVTTHVGIIIIAVIALLLISLIAGLVVYCKRRKKCKQQSIDDSEPFRPEQAAPSAPPAYDLEMTPQAGTGIESLPSYEEVVSTPHRFNSSRSSLRKISSYFRRNNEEQKI